MGKGKLKGKRQQRKVGQKDGWEKGGKVRLKGGTKTEER